MTIDFLLLLWALSLALTLMRLTSLRGRSLLVRSVVSAGVLFACYPWVSRVSLLKLLETANRPAYFDGIQLLILAEGSFCLMLFFLPHQGSRNPDSGKRQFFTWVPSPLLFLTSLLLLASVFYYQSRLSFHLATLLFSAALGLVLFLAPLLLKRSRFRLGSFHSVSPILAGALILTAVLIQGSRNPLLPVSRQSPLLPLLALGALVAALLLLGAVALSPAQHKAVNKNLF